MRDAFAEELESLISEDERVIFLTGDLGFGVFDRLRKNFPENFINVGVAEQNMTGIAAGLAKEGFKVFTYSIANFSTLRCLEQIRIDAAYHELNVNVVSVGGGFSYGPLGMSHHATEDLAIMRALPNVTVIAPGTIYEARASTKEIINQHGVGYLRIDKSFYEDDESKNNPNFKIGKAIRYKDGHDISLFATGGILEEAMAAAEELKKINIDSRVTNFHTLKPIDEDEIFSAVRETGGIVTIEEHSVIGGLGGAVAEVCLENAAIPKTFKRIGLNDTFSSIVGSQKHLRQRYRMDSKAIVEAVKENLQLT